MATKDATDASLLNLSQVAKRLGVSRRQVNYWVADGDLPSLKLGPRMIRVRPCELEAWLESKRLKGAAELLDAATGGPQSR